MTTLLLHSRHSVKPWTTLRPRTATQPRSTASRRPRTPNARQSSLRQRLPKTWTSPSVKLAFDRARQPITKRKAIPASDAPTAAATLFRQLGVPGRSTGVSCFREPAGRALTSISSVSTAAQPMFGSQRKTIRSASVSSLSHRSGQDGQSSVRITARNDFCAATAALQSPPGSFRVPSSLISRTRRQGGWPLLGVEPVDRDSSSATRMRFSFRATAAEASQVPGNTSRVGAAPASLANSQRAMQSADARERRQPVVLSCRLR